METRIERGLVWPADDTECAAVVFDTFQDEGMRAVKACKHRRTVVQAGGNAGVWPVEFAKHFSEVVTFEPDPLNFYCLQQNIKGFPTIWAYNYGLGDRPTQGNMLREPGNAGAHAMIASGEGPIKVTTIDAFCKDYPVDLIYLDIEGFEYFALQGAFTTIRWWRPIVVCEDKGLSERYGIAQGEVERYMAREHGYEVFGRHARDVFMRPTS